MAYTITKEADGKVLIEHSESPPYFLPNDALVRQTQQGVEILNSSYQKIAGFVASDISEVDDGTTQSNPTTPSELFDALKTVFNGAGSAAITTKQGHATYADDGTTPITFNATAKKLTFNGLGSATELRFRPEGGDLYDTSTQRVVSSNLGDGGKIRISLTTTSLQSNPQRIEFIFDIGSNATTPTIPIYTHGYTLKNDSTQEISMSFPWYSLETFLVNGGQIFGVVQSGGVTVAGRTLHISKNMDGSEILNSQP